MRLLPGSQEEDAFQDLRVLVNLHRDVFQSLFLCSYELMFRERMDAVFQKFFLLIQFLNKQYDFYD